MTAAVPPPSVARRLELDVRGRCRSRQPLPVQVGTGRRTPSTTQPLSPTVYHTRAAATSATPTLRRIVTLRVFTREYNRVQALTARRQQFWFVTHLDPLKCFVKGKGKTLWE